MNWVILGVVGVGVVGGLFLAWLLVREQGGGPHS